MGRLVSRLRLVLVYYWVGVDCSELYTRRVEECFGELVYIERVCTVEDAKD